MHATFLFGVEAKHDFLGVFVLAFNDILKVLYFNVRFHFQLQTTFVDNNNLMSGQDNNSVNLLFPELV